MNNRRFFAIVAIVLLFLVALALFWLLSRGNGNQVPNEGSGAGTSIFGNGGETNPPTGGTDENPTGETVNPTQDASGSASIARFPELASCDSPVSVERNDCVKRIAVNAGNPKLCAAILGTFGQTDCQNAVGKTPEASTDISARSYARYDFSFSTSSGLSVIGPASSTAASFSLGGALEKAQESIQNALKNPDSRLTADGFFQRLQSLPVALFSFSRFQAAPGMSLVAHGFGFTPEDNEVHIGSYSVTGLLSQKNGTEIAFSLPSSMEFGTYDAWVTNSKGTSQNPSRPIRLTITGLPLDPPVITGASPSVAGIDDTVTLSGSNFQGALGLYTSLGVLTKFSASNSTITFKISDFELVNKIKDKKGVKGNRMSVQVVVGTPQGYNQDSFTFDVQF